MARYNAKHPTELKELILQRYNSGCKHQDIAKETGLTYHQVKSVISHWRSRTGVAVRKYKVMKKRSTWISILEGIKL